MHRQLTNSMTTLMAECTVGDSFCLTLPSLLYSVGDLQGHGLVCQGTGFQGSCLIASHSAPASTPYAPPCSSRDMR